MKTVFNPSISVLKCRHETVPCIPDHYEQAEGQGVCSGDARQDKDGTLGVQRARSEGGGRSRYICVTSVSKVPAGKQVHSPAIREHRFVLLSLCWGRVPTTMVLLPFMASTNLSSLFICPGSAGGKQVLGLPSGRPNSAIHVKGQIRNGWETPDRDKQKHRHTQVERTHGQIDDQTDGRTRRRTRDSKFVMSPTVSCARSIASSCFFFRDVPDGGELRHVSGGSWRRKDRTLCSTGGWLIVIAVVGISYSY